MRTHGERLKIDTDDADFSLIAWIWKWDPGIRVYVTVRQLTLLSMSGHGKAQVDRLDGSHVSLRLSGHGEVSVTAITGESVDVQLDGHGDIDVEDLVAGSLRVSLDGHGDVRLPSVRAGETDVILDGHGDIAVAGGEHEPAPRDQWAR